MPKHPQQSPLMVSRIPDITVGPISRAMSLKRLSRVRMSWFALGAVVGIGASFFMKLLVTTVVMPEYRQFIGGGGSSAPQQQLAASPNAPAPGPALIAAAPAFTPAPVKTEVANTAPVAQPPAISYPRKLALKLGKGDTIASLLTANHVQTSEAQAVMKALKARLNPTDLKAGQKISVTLARHETLGDAAAVKELAIKLPNFDTIALERKTGGGFNVAASKEPVSDKTYRKFGKVRSSVFQAGGDAGIPQVVMNDLVKAFSYDIDFQREIHPGDSIEVLMDRKTAADGRVGAGGNVRYAALTLRGKKHEIFRFQANKGGDYAWYDAKGNSVKKSLIRTPLDVARITSGFGMRTHPIMGYNKMHKGVDFGAPTGTPIMAAGDGTVDFKGWKGGYGNFVVIKHNATYETAYAHMSRFGNISVGNRVKQGQIIGYVGSTGNSTGAHLHYEVRQNGDQVNPVAKQFNLASGLSGKQLAAFKTAQQSSMNELAILSGKKPAASTLAKAEKPAKAGKSSKASKSSKPSKTAKAEKSKPQKLASR
jgi:murein DD-endopeptidase MepM/ murein hydrolase activator NlpD